MKRPLAIVITGPTASGKSALAVSLAKKLQTEIISADSRQIFKGIPIATAVPTLEEREGITHHLLELLSLDSYYSAANFAEDSEKIISDVFRRNNYVIICGGSMMYLDALLKGIDDLPSVPEEIRDKLMSDWKIEGDTWLLNQLKNLDPDYYEKVDRQNLKRVFHAVEISITSSKPYSSLLTGNNSKKELPFDVLKFCLDGERSVLFSRINNRVLKMMETGLEEEARSVLPYRDLNSLNTVGIKEMFAWFDGIFSKDEAIARLQKNTRVYAKKQLTWHKRDKEMKYLDFASSNEENVRKILELVSRFNV